MVKDYYTKKFDLMCATEKIGEFILQRGERGRTFRIILDTDLSGNSVYAKLHVLQNNHVIEDKEVRFWISHRVMPANRINIEKVLHEIGLSEYDPFAILEYNNAACPKDYFWIKFQSDKTFYDVNYYAERIASNQQLIDDLRKRKLKQRVEGYYSSLLEEVSN